MFFYMIEKIALFLQLMKPKVVSLTQPALLKLFNGMANHAGHIYMESAGSGIKHLGS